MHNFWSGIRYKQSETRTEPHTKITKAAGTKIVVLTFDQKINWKKHIGIPEKDCVKRMKILAAKYWDADIKILTNT